jgi:bifunctional ADP-heptose synthase (sugar kinase/adenylyltransferase)
VTYVRGGVARNVAENMALLRTHPFLISVVGDDVAGMSPNHGEFFRTAMELIH